MNHSHSSSVSVMQRAKPNVNHLFRSEVYVNNFSIKYTSAHNKLMSIYFPLFFVFLPEGFIFHTRIWKLLYKVTKWRNLENIVFLFGQMISGVFSSFDNFLDWKSTALLNICTSNSIFFLSFIFFFTTPENNNDIRSTRINFLLKTIISKSQFFNKWRS